MSYDMKGLSAGAHTPGLRVGTLIMFSARIQYSSGQSKFEDLERQKLMKPFITHSGLVLPLDRVNVDTDQMVPKQFLKALTREGFGRILFYDWRYTQPGERPNPEFVLNFPRYKGASVL